MTQQSEMVMFKIELDDQQITDLLQAIDLWIRNFRDDVDEDEDIAVSNDRLIALYQRLDLRI